MGWNTTVVVLNDSLDVIAQDPNFGKTLRDAILQTASTRKPTEVISRTPRVSADAATVIETHHADLTTVVSVGQNFASVLVTSGAYHDNELFLLEELANKLGYKLERIN